MYAPKLDPLQLCSGDDPLSEFRDFEYREWEARAGAYEESWGHVTNAFVAPLLDVVGPLTGARTLDLATGPGFAADGALRRGAAVSAVDFSPQMIARARTRVADVDFGVADALALPFPDRTFDVVISNFGVQHFADPRRAFEEAARVLKPNGLLAFTIWPENIFNAVGEVLDSALAVHGDPTSRPPGPRYHELSDDAARRRLLAEAGFSPGTIDARLVVVSWRLDHPDELFEAELTGSVRSGARLREQTPDDLLHIRAAMAERIRTTYASVFGYTIPVAAALISGRRA